MKIALLYKLFTVKEVAEFLDLTDARVRQICIEQLLRIKAGNARFLNAREIDIIREYRESLGARRHQKV